ncbi:MAG: aminotransferase class III-fold pyridoxal phosphate-dependent enzyme [Actinomycetes bacterium]
MKRDPARLIDELSAAYTERFPRSAELDRRARRVMVDGGSHGYRLNRPFPVRIDSARGAYIRDVDGHDILDLWQGHFTNILGNNPEVVTSALAAAFASGVGLQHGQTDALQIETAELLCRCLGAEKVRFATSGTLATMYATMLSRAFTGRDLVLKAGGGWHGAQPWGLKGVYFAEGPQPWGPESEGLSAHLTDEVLVSRFNDPEDLTEHFRTHGERLACMIIDPFAGAGNFILAAPEYLRTARDLADRYGTLLILDEVISGFRFRAGDLGSLYGVRPDLVTVGKIAGGGMPFAAVAGRGDVLALCGREGGDRVAFTGGTFSGHPAGLLAAKTMISYLVENEAEVYPRLAAMGAEMRRGVVGAFAAEGVFARCTGEPNELVPGCSISAIHFPHDAATALVGPQVVLDPVYCNTLLSQRILQLALLLEDVYTLFGSCALGMAHSSADLERLGDACRAAARRIRPYL